MARQEVTGTRDLSFSRWHRTLPDDCTWIDIDSCHYCRYCSSLLALFELVQCEDEWSLEEACRRKIASITHRVGIRLGIPVFKIAHTGRPLRKAAVMEVGQPGINLMESHELAKFIDALHDCDFCRKHSGGRFKRRTA